MSAGIEPPGSAGMVGQNRLMVNPNRRALSAAVFRAHACEPIAASHPILAFARLVGTDRTPYDEQGNGRLIGRMAEGRVLQDFRHAS
jgi:hypothetical protein